MESLVTKNMFLFCIVVKNKEELITKANNSSLCNKDIKNIILKDSTIIIDWNMLELYFDKFLVNFKNVNIEELINDDKINLTLKFHQELSIIKTLDLLKTHDNIFPPHKNCGQKTLTNPRLLPSKLLAHKNLE